MATANTHKTIGQRYLYEVKRRYAKTQAIPVGDPAALKGELKECMEQRIREHLKLPKAVDVVYLHDSNDEDDDRQPTFKVNGVTLEYNYRSRLPSASRSKSAGAVAEKITKAEEARADRCKELAFLDAQMGSGGINAFKAYMRARYDKDAVALELSEKDFQSAVTEFLSTRRSHTCPL